MFLNDFIIALFNFFMEWFFKHVKIGYKREYGNDFRVIFKKGNKVMVKNTKITDNLIL